MKFHPSRSCTSTILDPTGPGPTGCFSRKTEKLRVEVSHIDAGLESSLRVAEAAADISVSLNLKFALFRLYLRNKLVKKTYVICTVSRVTKRN